MPSQLVSFRLDEKVIDWLEEQRQEHESVSQCAARLIRQIAGFPNPDNSYTVSPELLEEKISDIIEQRMNSVNSIVNDLVNKRFIELEARINQLESQLILRTPKTPRTRKQSEESQTRKTTKSIKPVE
jgi:hypothetical protein